MYGYGHNYNYVKILIDTIFWPKKKQNKNLFFDYFFSNSHHFVIFA